MVFVVGSIYQLFGFGPVTVNIGSLSELFAQFVWPKLDDPTTRIPSWLAAQLRDFVLQNETLRVAVLGGGAPGDAEGGDGASSSGAAGARFRYPQFRPDFGFGVDPGRLRSCARAMPAIV